jgi:hypothetical protein
MSVCALATAGSFQLFVARPRRRRLGYGIPVRSGTRGLNSGCHYTSSKK